MKDSNKKPWYWIPTLYYAEGLPFSIVRQMSQLLLKELGASLPFISTATSATGLAWTLKFMWSPFIDQIWTKRRWILGMELTFVAILMAMAFYLQFQVNIWIVWGVLFLIAIASATHDIACDGFYLDSLTKEDQAKYSGIQQMGYRLAMMTGSGFLLVIAGKKNWPTAILVAAGIFGLLFFWHFVMLRRDEQPRRQTGQRIKFIEGFLSFAKMPNMVPAIIFIFLFRAGETLLLGMGNLFMKDAGMSLAEIGVYSGTFGFLASLLATLSGGYFISKYGLRRMLWIFGLIQNLTLPLYGIFAFIHPPVHVLAIGIVVEQIANGLGNAAAVNFTMRQVHPDFKATHFAIASSVVGFSAMIFGGLSGWGAKALGYGPFFLVAFAVSLPGLFMIPMISRRPECQR